MGEKRLRLIGPGKLLQVIKEANDLLVKKEDIVEIKNINEEFIMIYYG